MTERKVQIRLYIYFLILFLYLAIGVFLFYFLEHKASVNERQIYKERCDEKRREIMLSLDRDIKISDNITINSPFYNSIMKKLDEIDQCHLNYNRKYVKEVDLPNAISFVYAITITLGSGDIYAITNEGKIFFVLFTTISIPLIIAFYTDMTESGIASIVSSFNYLICFVKNKLSKVTRYELEREHKKKAPYYVIFFICLIIIYLLCTWNHYYQSQLAQSYNTIIQSMTFIFENFALIGLGYNVPRDTVKYLTREIPLMFIGSCLFSLYINFTINFIRHLIPKYLNEYEKKKSVNFVKYIIYEEDEKN